MLGAVQATLILAITIIAVPLPAIGHSMGLSRAGLALVSQAYGLSFSGLLLLGGRLADLGGPRRVFRLGVAVFAVASAGAAIAPGPGTLLAARFVQGCGAALAAPAAMALLPAIFPDPSRRARATAIWGSLAVTGANAGTVLSGVMLTVASWRWTFAIPVAVAAGAAVAAPRLLPPGPPPRRRPLDLPGALLATAAVTGISYGLVTSAEHPWTSIAVLGPMLGGVVAAAALVAVESRAREPLLPPGLLASARAGSALGVIALTAAASAGTTFALSLYFQQVRGFSPVQTSAAFLPFALVIVTGRLGGWLVGAFGPRAVAAGGLALTSAGLLLAGRIGTATPYPGLLLAGLLILPLGMGLAFSGATVAAVREMAGPEAALTGGVVNTAMEIGPNLGVASVVAIAGARSAGLARAGLPQHAAASGGYALALSAAGVAFAIAAALVAITVRTRRTRQGGHI